MVLITSCGVKRNNFIAKKYHNTTTFFNYYYNGELVWNEGVKQINAAYRVPAEGYIPVWWAGTEEDSKTYADNFEKAIEKAEIALQKHNQKDNKWIDNCRFLIGRSWFYKRNYILAIKNFEYVIKTYPDSKVIPDVYLWMVKTYYMDGNNSQALKMLDEQIPKLKLKKRQKGELALIRAQVHLDEGNHPEVIRTLNANKKFIKGKTNRARVHYLLGQLFADQGSFAKAYDNFKRVTKINTDYELIFNAKINIAKLFIREQSETDQAKKLRRFLKKMLRDEKNLDYKDRVYYEMAMLDLKLEDRDGAIENLKNSIAFNTNNQRQKALSYYKIGQIYFYDLQDFTNAQAYFDSASTAITRDAPEYREISTISKTLKEYIQYVNTIQLQDSLLELSYLSDAELEREVDRIIADQKAREEAKREKELEELNRLNDPNLFNQFGENKSKRGSGFYFDQQDLVSSGKVEFERFWGRRKNEDNWRRKNKQIQIQEETQEIAIDVSDEDLEKYGSKEKALMVKMVPRTAEDKAEAHQKVIEALYGLGQVYDNKLNIEDSAITTYNKLIRRYPDSEYSLKARYALFKMYKEKGDEVKADEYKLAICGKYPDSRYCKYCRNENVEDETDEQFEEFMSAYKALLETFNNKDWGTCITFSEFITTRFANTGDDLAEVYYIRGNAFGQIGAKDSLRAIYTRVRTDYPDADVTPVVIRTLNKMDGVSESTGKPTASNGNDDNNAEIDTNDPRYRGFTMQRKPHEKFYVVMLIKKEKLKSNELQVKLNDFNKKYYQEKRLNVSIFLYKNVYHMPYVSQFDREQDALDFIKTAAKEPEINDLFNSQDEKMVFISPSNFRTAYGKKRFEDYFLYYENVVLKSLDGN